MKLTRSDSKRMIRWSLSGLIVICVYKLVSIYTTYDTDTNQLTPDTEALVKDMELFILFCRLQKYKHIDLTSFESLVNDTDRLMLYHVQLESEQIQPSIADRPTAFMFFKSAIKSLDKFVATSKLNSPGKEYVEVHQIYKLIYSNLEEHWNSVLKLTQYAI